MIKLKKSPKKFKLPEYGLFGFEILNHFHSTLCAYGLIAFELLIVPFFGYDRIQIIAGVCFVLLINLSIIILFLNSLSKLNGLNINILILNIPLYIYIPFSCHKVVDQILHLISFDF